MSSENELVIDNAFILFGRNGRLGAQIEDTRDKQGAGLIRRCYLVTVKDNVWPRFLHRKHLHRWHHYGEAMFAAKQAYSWTMRDRNSVPPPPLVEARIVARSFSNGIFPRGDGVSE